MEEIQVGQIVHSPAIPAADSSATQIVGKEEQIMKDEQAICNIGSDDDNDDAINDCLPLVEGEEKALTDELKTRRPLGGVEIRAAVNGTQFMVAEGKVYWIKTKFIEGKEPEKTFVPLSSEIRVISYARDSDNKTWGRLLEFKDHDGFTHQYLLKMEHVDGEGILSELRSMGVIVNPERGVKEKLSIYLQDTAPQSNTRIRCVAKTGWHDKTFVFANGQSVGNNEDHYAYLGSNSMARAVKEQGTIDEWKSQVARYCSGNSRLMLAVSAGFAATLLHQTGEESGGINLYGSSSIGKTTALFVASSVFGDPNGYIMSWRATANGLEGAALRSNDSLLILDEFGQIDPKDAGDTAYMLANGSGKTRSNKLGDPRPTATWNLIYLSTGEITLADHMSEGGKKAKAGQEIRLLDISADPGKGHGLFDILHEFSSGAVLSETLKKNATRYHGTAIKLFLEKVLEHFDGLPSFIHNVRQRFQETYLTVEMSGQVRRVANRFALIAAGGEFASAHGVTGWKQNEAFQAVGVCFNDWLTARGGSEHQEVTALLRQVRQFFELHGDSRFVKMHDIGMGQIAQDRFKTNNRAGFSRESEIGEGNTRQKDYEYFVLPEAFREICSGHNPTFAAKVLVKHGYILPGSDGKPQSAHRLPTIGQKRVYHFTTKVLADNEHLENRVSLNDGKKG